MLLLELQRELQREFKKLKDARELDLFNSGFRLSLMVLPVDGDGSLFVLLQVRELGEDEAVNNFVICQ